MAHASCSAAAVPIEESKVVVAKAPIPTSAALQLACAIGGTIPGGVAHGLGTGEHLAADLVEHTLVASGGMLALPDRPGLGVAPEDAAWERVAEGDWVTAS